MTPLQTWQACNSIESTTVDLPYSISAFLQFLSVDRERWRGPFGGRRTVRVLMPLRRDCNIRPITRFLLPTNH